MGKRSPAEQQRYQDLVFIADLALNACAHGPCSRYVLGLWLRKMYLGICTLLGLQGLASTLSQACQSQIHTGKSSSHSLDISIQGPYIYFSNLYQNTCGVPYGFWSSLRQRRLRTATAANSICQEGWTTLLACSGYTSGLCYLPSVGRGVDEEHLETLALRPYWYSWTLSANEMQQ